MPTQAGRCAVAAVVAAVVAVAAGCSKAPNASSSEGSHATTPVTLMLDWYPNADHAGIFAAMDRGDFAREGLRVQPETPATTTVPLQLVATGKVPFAISYEPDLLIAVAQGLPVRAVFALVPQPLNSVISLRSSGITRPRQLVGRKVGTSGLPGDTAVLDAVVAYDGGNPAKVHQVNVGYNLVQSLMGHKVDAIVGGYWNWEAVQIAQQGMPVNVMRLQQWGVPTYDELVVVTSAHIVQTDPSLVRSFDAALAAGVTYAAGHPTAAADDVLRANTSLSRALVDRSVALLRPLWQGEGAHPGYMDPTLWSRYAAWMLARHLLPEAVSVNQAMTDAFLPK